MSPFRPLAILLVVWFSTSPATAQPAAGPDPVAELKRRTPPDAAAIQKKLDNLKGMAADSMGVELYELQKLHERSKENWAKLEAARGSDAFGTQNVAKRGKDYTIDLWKNGRTRNIKLRSIRQREEAAYDKKYKEPFTPYAKNAKAWAATNEAQAFDTERKKAEADFAETFKKITESATTGNTDRDRELDDLQKKLLYEYQVTANAVKTAQKAFDEKTAAEAAKAANKPVPPPINPPPPTTNVVRPPRLFIDLSGNPHQIVEVGETLELTLVFDGGKPPYMLLTQTSEGGVQTLPLPGPGSRTVPTVFKTSRFPHHIEFTLIDDEGKMDVVKYRVSVQPKRDVKKPDPPAPPVPPKPPVPPPPKPLLTPISGTYHAVFDIAGGILKPGHPWATRAYGNLDTPVILTFETGGAITGRCDYTFPVAEYTAEHRQYYQSLGWKTKFTIRGTVDWATGKIELTIPDAKIEYFFVKDRNRYDYTVEYAATYRGRHVTDPFWLADKLHVQIDNRIKGLRALTESGDLVGDGRPGETSADAWGHRFGVKPDPGVVTGDIRIRKSVLKIDGNEIPNEQTQFILDNEHAVKTGGWGWAMKLLGPDTTRQDLAKAELVGTSLWPERHTTANVGETVFTKFVGVFSDDYTQIRELNDVADWQIPPGLTQVRPGVFRADTPGKYDVRARAKGKDGVVMEGFVTIEVK